MMDHHPEIGLGLKMDGPTHFSDLTNLAVSPRNATVNVHQNIESSQHANDAFAHQNHMNMTHGASYDPGPQNAFIKHTSTSLNVFSEAHLDTENVQSGNKPGPPQHQQHTQASDADSQSENVQSTGLAQAFGFNEDSQTSHQQTSAQANQAADHFIGSSIRCSDSQATVQADAEAGDNDCLTHVPHDQASAAASVQHQLDPSPAVKRHQFNSYPSSPHPQTDLRFPDSGTRPGGGRQVASHRPSHSLGQAAAFMSSVSARELFVQNHVSAPVSPSEGMSAGPFPTLFQYPGHRQDLGLGMAEHGHISAHGGTSNGPRHQANFAASSAPSARSTSPSASLASTSLTSISPLGSARINHDGSFTSQECSFDSLSNTASGSFSRASSASEDVFSCDLGSLGLASSLRMSKQKKKLRNIDRKMICDYSAANPQVKQDAIAVKFGIERSTVSKILKQKEKWLAIEPGSDAARIAKHRAVKFPAVEDRLTTWAAELKARGEVIRDSTIRHEALRIARELGLGEDKFKASGGWIEKFRDRNQILKPQSRGTNNAESDVAGLMGGVTPSASSSDMSLALKPEDSSDTSKASSMSTADPSGSTEVQSPTARRQSGRNIKAKVTPQKRARDELEKTQAILGMSPLSQDLARMHFQSGYPPAPMPHPAFFRPDMYMGHQSMPPPPVQNYAVVYQSHDGVSDQHQVTEEDAESDRKRRRALEEFQANQAQMALGPAIDFQFAEASASSSQIHFLGQTHDAHSQEVTPSPKNSARGRRSASKPSAGASRGRSHRGKGRLSNANHTPQTPSPLSMSPADAGAESSFRNLSAADAEQLTAAALERIRALQNSGEGSSLVTAEQAQQSLELVLRFLREQPSDFLPPNHFVVFGHLQANIEQKIRDQSTDDETLNEAGDLQTSRSHSSSRCGEANSDAIATSIEEQQGLNTPSFDGPSS